jgi:hypothetical protein
MYVRTYIDSIISTTMLDREGPGVPVTLLQVHHARLEHHPCQLFESIICYWIPDPQLVESPRIHLSSFFPSVARSRKRATSGVCRTFPTSSRPPTPHPQRFILRPPPPPQTYPHDRYGDIYLTSLPAACILHRILPCVAM